MLIAQSPFQGIIEVSKPLLQKGKVIKMANKTNDLAHTKWMCKYHIVFTPKYRRKIIYNQYKESIRDILKQLCAYKGVEIIEGHLMPDHIHMLVSIPPKYSVSQFMGYLKGKSALMIYDKHANLKYKFGNRHFRSEGYYVSTVGLNEATIKSKMQQEVNPITGEKIFNFASGISLLLFYAFAMQCASTLAITKKETNSWKWPLIQFVFMSAMAYFIALIAFQILH